MQLNHWAFSHELLHLWLGGAIQPQEAGVVWFQEGIPSYYAALSVCQFLFDIETESKSRRFLESLREWYAKAKQITGFSLEKAASTFGGDDERSYEVIYNKGPLVCWMLDVEIRVATGNRKCLADLMKILYQRFGNQPKAYSNNDVFAIASELGGQDYDWIYQKYILGTEPIPFENYLAKASILSE
jgi:predicted metalloprotease with PDZ domain